MLSLSRHWFNTVLYSTSMLVLNPPKGSILVLLCFRNQVTTALAMHISFSVTSKTRQRQEKDFFLLFLNQIWNLSEVPNIGVRAGGGGGEGGSPPKILGNSDFLGNKRKFGQSQVLKTFPCCFLLF